MLVVTGGSLPSPALPLISGLPWHQLFFHQALADSLGLTMTFWGDGETLEALNTASSFCPSQPPGQEQGAHSVS